MDVVKQLNQMMNFIEDNLTENLLISELIQMTSMSEMHFKSMFMVITDVTLLEYIRRRRLSQAAIDLQHNDSVTEVTFKYGYTSPDAFTRAFRKLHGVNPSVAKNQNINLKTYPKLSFTFSIKGANEMNFKILTKEPFKMYGIERIINNVDGENLKQIPEFWNDVMADGSFKKLLASTNKQEHTTGIYAVNGVMCYDQETMEQFPYAIAAFKTDVSNTEGFKEIEIGSYQWVVFTTQDYKADQTVTVIQDLWRRIYAEWLPTSGYSIIDGPNLELYGNRDETYEYCEVWLPIEKIN